MANIVLPKIFVNNEMYSFIKHISLIILNSRISQRQKKNIGIPKTLFSITQKENFDIDDLFQLDSDYTFLSSPTLTARKAKENSNEKVFFIEIYLTGSNILVEKWKFSYIYDIEIVATKRYLEKKLSVIARSIFFICKALPCFCLLRDNQNVFYYKVYKSAKSNGIFDEDFDVKRITITNEKIKCGVSVEYISSKDLLGQFQVEKNKNDVYVGNDENDFDFCVYKKRPRFFSESIKKKINPSYEILNFSTEDPIKLNDNYFTVNNNMTHSPSGKRKLSVQYDSKDNLIHLLSNEEIEGLGPFEKEEEKDSEINLKLEDSSVPSLTESSHCEFQLNIEDEAGNTKILNEEDNLNLSQFKNLVSILTKIKQSYKKNRTKKKINVNRLYKLMCNK